MAERRALTWFALAALWPSQALAQTLSESSAGGLGLPTLVALGTLSLVPLLLMVCSSFVKLSLVLSLLRNALGVPELPSGAVITALAAILSVYVMTPVALEAAAVAAEPSARVDFEHPLRGDSRQALLEVVERGREPLRAFLERNAGERERGLFLDLARRARPEAEKDEVGARDFMVVLPAFLITELAEAFVLGFAVLLPFLVIDLVVSNVLLALGLSLLSPSTVALPFKLLLFVLVDGWYVLSQALVSGYA
ncbi:MAG: type III secretion system export apparatus subunit SctR [Myxococcales bacterium]|nr:type III secretion system export apparatus subunit SctR [Myxococcales bacterium]